MKKSGVLGLLVIFVLLISMISVNLVIAENNESDNETDTEPETETCAASISVDFDKNTYNKGDSFEMTVEVFDLDGSRLPNYAFYAEMYDNMWHSASLMETGNDGIYRQSGAVEKPAGGVTKVKFKVYTQESASCSRVDDMTEIEIIYEEEEREPIQRPEPTTTACAASISINFDKTGYVPGDTFSVEIGVFDSRGNPIPNYDFYVKMYDDRWHTPDFKTTGSDGYFRQSGEVPEKTIQGVTKGIFNAYTKEFGFCKSVEDTTELFLEELESEPVPCGIGTCVPEEKGEVEEIPENKILYRCSGCELEGKCYPIGYRKEGRYCSDNEEFVSQIDGNCDNNFECKSNVCISGECVEEGLMRRIINWFKKLFGVEDEEQEADDKICRKLLVEKDIEDYKYFITEYGKRKEQQVGLFSEEGGEQIGIVKCCVAGYKNPDGDESAGIVCPFDNREDVENSLQWLVSKGELVLGEYKGQKIYRRFDKPEEIPEVIAWTNNAYLIASGVGPGEGPLSEEVANAYLKKYPSDL